MTKRALFCVLAAVAVIIVCLALSSTPAQSAEIQTMPAAADVQDQAIRGRIQGPRGGHIGGEITGPRDRGDEGLKPLKPEHKFEAPSPVRVVGGVFHLTLQLVRIALDILVVSLLAYLVYKGVRRVKGKETRLGDTIEKIKAKRAVVIAKLKDQRAALDARIQAAEGDIPDA